MCPSCGAEVAAAQRFCTRCGASALSAKAAATQGPGGEIDPTATAPSVKPRVGSTPPRGEAPPPPPPSVVPVAAPPLPPLDLPRAAPALPPLPSGVPGRRRVAVVVGLAVAVLIAAAAVGGVVWQRHSDGAAATAATGSVAKGASAGSSTSAVPTPAATVTVTASAVPAPPQATAPAPPSYRCWNGRHAASLADCGTPMDALSTAHPLSGLNWVFPDRGAALEAAGATCYDEADGSKAQMRTCSVSFEGVSVCSHWTQWSRASMAMADYRHGGTPTSSAAGPGTVLTWPAFGSPGTTCDNTRWAYKTSRMMEGQPWGVTFYAPTAAVANDAMARFASMRPLDQWAGVQQ